MNFWNSENRYKNGEEAIVQGNMLRTPATVVDSSYSEIFYSI